MSNDHSGEIPLQGGNVSSVVRIGDSVHRTAGPWSATIHRLLIHARSRGATGIPQPLGFDEIGREVLAFIPGQIPHDQPDWLWTEETLSSAASMLRRWHDATTGFPTEGAVWGFPYHQPAETICHNDFAPYNTVFLNRKLVGLIDFDFCAPGPRIRDLAWAAYRFVPYQPSKEDQSDDNQQERSPFDRSTTVKRLDRFIGAYQGGNPLPGITPLSVRQAMVPRLLEIADWTENHVLVSGKQELAAHARMYRAHATWIRNKRLSRCQLS